METASVTIQQLDQAFADRFQAYFAGEEIFTDLITVRGKPVRIYIERPETSYSEERVYPAISIHLTDITNDPSRLESECGGVEVRSTATTRVLIPDPEPYKVGYQIEGWSRNPKDDRELTQQLIASFKINDSLLVDGEYWSLEKDPMVTLDDTSGSSDQKVYRKIWPIDLIVVMLADKIETTVHVVLETHTSFRDENKILDHRLVDDGTTLTTEFTEL